MLTLTLILILNLSVSLTLILTLTLNQAKSCATSRGIRGGSTLSSSRAAARSSDYRYTHRMSRSRASHTTRPRPRRSTTELTCWVGVAALRGPLEGWPVASKRLGALPRISRCVLPDPDPKPNPET